MEPSDYPFSSNRTDFQRRILNAPTLKSTGVCWSSKATQEMSRVTHTVRGHKAWVCFPAPPRARGPTPPCLLGPGRRSLALQGPVILSGELAHPQRGPHGVLAHLLHISGEALHTDWGSDQWAGHRSWNTTLLWASVSSAGI